MKKARLFKQLKHKNVKCTACHHFCKISEKHTGICSVRQNINGELQLIVYGKAVASNIDPIEKKPLFHFLPASKAYSIGTLGCNFRCDFCQNYDISQGPKELEKKLIKNKNLDKLDKELTKYSKTMTPEEIVNFCKKRSIPTIAYTYNEPTTFFEYTYDTAKLASKEGIKNIYVSNGFMSDKLINLIVPYLDGINIDLKSFSDEFYKKICGGKLDPVLKNIKNFYKNHVWIEVTTLVIPGENDSVKELTQIGQFISSVSKSIPWHISRFSPNYKMQNKPRTSEESIKRAYNIGKEAGLKYVYAGNIFGKDVHSTYCPSCGEVLIERDWGSVEVKNLKNGKCENCGEKILGIWK